MKYLLAFTVIASLMACNQSDNKIVEALTKTDPTDNNNILGQWTMCSTLKGGMMIQANVCPTISFETNGRGYVN